MRIGYFSDLHTELMKADAAFTPKDRRIGRIISRESFGAALREAYRAADVIVAAGDIGEGGNAVRFLAATFPDQMVVYTPGNHDFWSGEVYAVLSELNEAAQGTTVQVLATGETIEFGGVLFCGATLWTDFDLMSSRDTLIQAESLMRDFKKIRLRRGSRSTLNKLESPAKLRAMDLLAFHRNHLASIKDAIEDAAERNMPLVVVTHHAPSARSLLPSDEVGADMAGYIYQDTDPCYASHLDHLLQEQSAPQIWIHGHTHVATRYQVGRCQVVSNPKGYSENEETGWEAGRMITLMKASA